MSMKGWLEQLNIKGTQLKTTYWLIVLAIVGIGMMMIYKMILPSPSVEPVMSVNSKNTDSRSSTDDHVKTCEQEWEEELQHSLGAIEGVGEIVVDVAMDVSQEIHYAANEVCEVRTTEEKDTQGGTRKITERKENTDLVLLNNNAVPVPIKTMGSQLKGVLVVAEGARNSYVKLGLVRAVQTVTGLPSHKITIIAKEVH